MTKSKSQSIVGLCAAAASLLAAAAPLRAETAGQVPPPMSYARAQYLAGHPQARSELMSALAAGPAAKPVASAAFTSSTAGGTWALLPKANAALSNPLLLTDGTVIVQHAGSFRWSRLTPDINGSYANGTWSKIATLPVIDGTQYARCTTRRPCCRTAASSSWAANTTATCRYGPTWARSTIRSRTRWTAVSAPPGWGYSANGDGVIGDAQSVVLANGTFMQAECCSLPDGDALLDPTTLTWKNTGAPRLGNFYQDEQGYSLLPNGHVLTIDIWTDLDFNTGLSSGNATNAEQYNPGTGLWTSAGNMPVSAGRSLRVRQLRDRARRDAP